VTHGDPPLPDFILHHFETLSRDESFVRMMVWEGMTGGASHDIGTAERRAGYRGVVEYLKRQQAEGALDKSLDPAMTLLMIIAANAFAQVFPQIVELVTGLSADDPRLTRRFRRSLRQHAALLAGRSARGRRTGEGVA